MNDNVLFLMTIGFFITVPFTVWKLIDLIILFVKWFVKHWVRKWEMTEKELKEKMNKDLNEVFDVKEITNFMFNLIQKAYLKGIKTGIKISRSEK